MKINAEELAAKRFPQVEGEPLPLVQRAYYAEGITEVAQPLQDRVEELEAALKAFEEHFDEIRPDENDRTKIPVRIGYVRNARAILAKHA